MVADPRRRRGVGAEGGEETGSYRRDDGAEDHERRVVADDGNDQAGSGSGHDVAHQHGESPDAGFDGADALHGLEPDGDVVGVDEEAGADGELVEGAGPDCSGQEDARRYGGILLHAPLDEDEEDHEDAEDDEQSYDPRVVPGIHGAAPLQSEQDADDGRHEKDGAQGIEAEYLLPE